MFTPGTDIYHTHISLSPHSTSPPGVTTSILLLPLSSVIIQVLSQGSSNGVFGTTGQQHLEE